MKIGIFRRILVRASHNIVIGNKILNYLEFIKFHHTLFALPFAVISAFYVSNGIPSTGKIFWILIAMIGARSSAMAFNRIVDLKYDIKNKRTMNRPLASGRIKKTGAILFTLISILIFIYSAYKLNYTCFLLSPLALLIILGYSLTKRFTKYSHFFLGLALGISPIGAWLAIKPELTSFPLLLSLYIIFWTAGFDIIYSLMDEDFDRTEGLYSFPAVIGKKKSLVIARILHLISFCIIVGLAILSGGKYFLLGALCSGVIMFYEHYFLKEDDIKSINRSFFYANALISLILLISILLDIFISL